MANRYEHMTNQYEGIIAGHERQMQAIAQQRDENQRQIQAMIQQRNDDREQRDDNQRQLEAMIQQRNADRELMQEFQRQLELMTQNQQAHARNARMAAGGDGQDPNDGNIRRPGHGHYAEGNEDPDEMERSLTRSGCFGGRMF